jgi:hypothetical protein
MVIHRFPGNLSINDITKVIDKVEKHLLLKDDTLKESFFLEVTTEQTYSILSILVLYKFMLYTVVHKIFANPVFKAPDEFERELNQFGFKKLFEKIVSGKPDRAYNFSSQIRPSYKDDDEFIILPHTLGNPDSQKQNKLENDLATIISKFYKSDIKLDVILTCLTEILSKFL